MHQCAAECCADSSASLEQVHGCIEKCGQDIHKAQNYVQNELGHFQRRLERCAMDCQDKIRDKIDPKAKETEMEKFKAQYEDCVYKCVDSQMHSLPKLTKRMNDALKYKNYSTSHI